jgi:hypothetical protein
MREPKPLGRRIPRIKWLAFALVLSLAFVLRFNAWPIYRQHAIVAEFRARGFYVAIVEGYPPGCLDPVIPTSVRQSVYTAWSDAFGEVIAITGQGDAGREFTDRDFSTVLALPALRELDLGHSRITDAGLVQLEKKPDLKYLLIDNTQIGDAGVAHLRDLTNLKVLHLGKTRITDAALADLAGMKNLRKLSVQKTRVTRNGIARLRRALPELTQIVEIAE